MRKVQTAGHLAHRPRTTHPQSALRRGAGALRRWTAAAAQKLLGPKPPSIENRTAAVSKLTQKHLDEMCSRGDLKSIHSRGTSRTRVTQRVRFLNGCCEPMLDALAAFESKRALLGEAHLESPLTQKLLLGTEVLLKAEDAPWKTDEWQVELITLFGERFFRQKMQKPVESAAVWAHVARVVRGVAGAIDEFAATCDTALVPKVMARKEEVLAGDFDAELVQFSQELLKLNPDETQIPAAQYPRLPLFSEMQIWQASPPAPGQLQPVAEESAQAMVAATAAAGAAVVQQVAAVQDIYNGIFNF